MLRRSRRRLNRPPGTGTLACSRRGAPRPRSYNAAPPNGRCLKLQLTDGVQTLAAIEHSPVPELQVHLPAGTKVRPR